jgi:ribulose bisphosphate carboxylase small subunit
MLRDALIELNRRVFPGNRADEVPGGVTFWFKQDEIHQATHVHGGPEFLPWHREIVNRIEGMLRQVNPHLSLHYWDWTQDPRAIPNANLGGGRTGTLNLFTDDFMGWGGPEQRPIAEPWLNAGFYQPGAANHRDATGNPADPPQVVTRSVGVGVAAPASSAQDQAVVAANDYRSMRELLEDIHNDMHGFVAMGGQHISFRDPFVFLLHSNVDRLFAFWQTQPDHPERLDPEFVYGPESNNPALNGNVEPWSTGHSFDQFGGEHFTRPWFAPESEGVPKTYKHPSTVIPPMYDTTIRDPLGAIAARHNLTSAQHQQAVNHFLATGYRPTWVNGYSVEGQDRYASIWERRTGSALVMRHNLTRAQHQALVDELFPQGFRPTCISGYSVDGQDRFASIWDQRPGPAVVARHNLTGAQHQALVDELFPQGFRPKFVNGYTVGGQELFTSVWDQRPGPAMVARHNLTSAEHQQTAEQLFGQGFRPVSVSGYAAEAQDRYASVWEEIIGPDFYASIWEKTSGPELIARHNLTATQHQQTVEALFAQGFRPAWVSGYCVLGEDRYTSIWVKQPGPAMVARHNLSSDQHQETVEQLFAQGFRPICVSGYTVDGQDFYASIWEQSSGPEVVTRHNLDGDQHQETAEQLFAQGFRPTCVSGYGSDGQQRFASIWVKSAGPELVARHRLTGPEHQQTVDQLLGQGFRPTCVSGYAVDGQDFYASIWVKTTGPDMVVRHNLTSAQHQQAVEQLFAQGFRPTCVSGYSIR